MSLAQALKKTSQSLTEAEQFLRSRHIAYEEQADGTLAVDHLDLGNMKLEKLPDLSKVFVREYFWCHNNRLTSLAGAPFFVGGDFRCDNNILTSLAGAPQMLAGEFGCRGNRLSSLEHAPQTFKNLMSDFGDFSVWDLVPENLRMSPETKKTRLGILKAIETVSSQKQPFKAAPSIRFKTRPK